MTKEEKQKQVKEILCMPIVCEKRKTKIIRECKGGSIGDVIYTGQTYSRRLDEDMSDFAVGFYEIIYKDILCTEMLLEKDLNNKEFAGDTMNSFNTTANSVPEAGKSAKQRTIMGKWPEYLQKYHAKYHCLANFWIIPMEMGRGLRGELNKARRVCDYMDRFLEMIKQEVRFDMPEDEREYFRRFDDRKDFIDRHFINCYFEADEEEKLKIKKYSNNNAEKFIAGAMERIEERADEIAKSKYMDKLWDYFNSKRLFESL